MAGIEVTCYDMQSAVGAAANNILGSGAGDTQMIVTLQHGWRGYEVRDFLLQQPEVTAVEWDTVKTVPDRLKPSTIAKPSKKGGKKKEQSKLKRKKRKATISGAPRGGEL